MPRVSIQNTAQFFEISNDRILFEALADQGLELPHGCLAGSCGACRVHVESGADNLAPAGAIEQNTIDAIIQEYREKKGEEFAKALCVRLSCRAKVKGDVVLRPLAD